MEVFSVAIERKSLKFRKKFQKHFHAKVELISVLGLSTDSSLQILEGDLVRHLEKVRNIN